jgi:hypothetical protein
MTRRTNATIAGVTFLLYIAVGLTSLFLGRGATAGEGAAAKLASIAQHVPQMRSTVLLGLSTCFMAIVLAVTLYGITRDEDHELAVFGLVCRLGEGLVGVVSTVATLGLLWLATDAAESDALASFLFKAEGWSPLLAATLFAVGSTVFCWLLLRGRMVPASLAWLGVVASVLLVVVLPLQLAGILGGAITQLVWLPMLAFEVPLAVLLIFKGVAPVRIYRE